jgi:TetR/AcrR family transcriptional regulator, transcriptional repressor for nem operon
MRYPPDQKAKARNAILQAGAETLRENGFNGVGVDALAAAAGVTSGAFYSNFANKEALLEGVIDKYLGMPFIEAVGTVAERREVLRVWLKEYISLYHRDHPALGCVMPTLSADVARAGPAVRAAYQRRMIGLVGKIATVLGGAEADREKRAWNIVALMVGAIEISRATRDNEQSRQPIEHALSAALALIDS